MFLSEVSDFFQSKNTPFYFYDIQLLEKTLEEVKKYGLSKGYHIHFALKANNQPKLLESIRNAGLGADCVSGGEVERAIQCGFSPEHIAFAGVGKSDSEIELGLKHDIFCFNVESFQELEVLNELAEKAGKVANVALRLNPNVDAKTHKYITTGLKENKFGINMDDLDLTLEAIPSMKNLKLIGIHFHIGSQIVELQPFIDLAKKANELNNYIENKGHKLEVINVGGGYGIDYESPDENPIPDFEAFFGVFDTYLEKKAHQQVHFELGRAIIGQCGSLITKVLYIKTGRTKNFAVVDAGMTELLRPALYQAKHGVSVLKDVESAPLVKYDVVGPICESSDSFRTDIELPQLFRGDLVALRSAGAYGEVMRSAYNLRTDNGAVFSDEI